MGTTVSGSAVTAPATTYCTLAEARAQCGITDPTDTTDDSKIIQAIAAVSRWIDEECGRRFYTTSSDETRYFTTPWSDRLYAGDVVSITTLATDDDGDRTYETTWTATDYELRPYNAALDSKPYLEIWTTPNGSCSFSTQQKGVKIVGKFGWSTTPSQVKSACLIQVERLFKRKDAPFGVAGSGEMGQMSRIPTLDPDVKILLAPFRRAEAVIVALMP